MAAAWGRREGIAARVSCDALDGWLLIPKPVTEDDLYPARAPCVQPGAALGNAAAKEERVRVVHDLHDGILQFLRRLLEDIRPRHSPMAESGQSLATLLPGLADQWDISIDADIAAELATRCRNAATRTHAHCHQRTSFGHRCPRFCHQPRNEGGQRGGHCLTALACGCALRSSGHSP